jgi:hypothetical protein
MIDLNKYYIAKKYAGPSGAYPSVGGFVPPATSGDSSKFLRGDGSWAEVNTDTISGMVGATSGTDGQAGLVPKPVAGDNRYFLRGDGAWSDPTISQIQYIENSNNITLDVANYSAFVVNLTESATFTYSGFENGKTINVYLAASHTGHLPHTFPLNTTFSELGDDNTIYSFEDYTTRILLQDMGDYVYNFSSVVKTPSGLIPPPPPPPYYYGNSDINNPPGVGLDIVELYLNDLLAEFGF